MGGWELIRCPMCEQRILFDAVKVSKKEGIMIGVKCLYCNYRGILHITFEDKPKIDYVG